MDYESGDGETVETENIEETVLALGYKAFVAFLGVGTVIVISKRKQEDAERSNGLEEDAAQ